MAKKFVVMERGYQTDGKWERVTNLDFDTKFEAQEFAQELFYSNWADKEIGGYDPEYETKVVEVGESRKMKVLNYQEFIDLARTNYNLGGDGFYECWDERTFNEYVKEFGEITKSKARQMFKEALDIERDRAGWY